MIVKKLIGLTLSLALVLSMIVTVNAVSYVSGDYKFTVDNGEVEIVSYNGNDTSLDIPDTIKGFPVVSIAEQAFRECGLVSVTLPENLKSIESGAFADNKSLYEVKFNSVLESIGDTAFYNCESLSSALRFPEKLKTIGESAFENCWDMTYVIIPASVESIGYSAFGYYYEIDDSDSKYYDYKRSDFRILGYPDTAAYAYAEKQQLDFYDMNMGVTAVSVDNMDFLVDADKNAELISYNGKLLSVTIPEKVEGYAVKSIAPFSFYNSEIRSVSIPDTVEKVGEWAFENCEYLASVKIPPSVTEIGEGAFGFYYEERRNTPYNNFVVQGAPSSAAKAYADENGFEFEDVYTTFLTLSKYSGSVYVKGSLQIQASVKNAVGKNTYTSSNSKIAKVNSSGKITAVKAGKAKITVKNNGAKKVFTVTVKNPKLNKTKITAKIGKVYKLKIMGKIGSAKFTCNKKKIVKLTKKGIYNTNIKMSY